MDFSQLPITYIGTVIKNEIDDMDHMNVAYYAEKYNQATIEFLELFEFGKEYRSTKKFGSFILEHHIKYIAEVRLGEAVTIYTQIINSNRKLTHFIHFLVKDRNQELSSTCECVNIHINRKNSKSYQLPDNIYNNITRMKKAHQSLDWQAPVSGIIKINNS